jgi:hypothetical protein
MEGVAAAIAYSAPAAQPPPELRDRLLEAIGPTVVAPPAEVPAGPERRWAWWPRFSAFAVPALAAAVVALAVWNVALRNDHGPRVQSVASVANVGSVVSYEGGQATIVGSLRPAPANHVYEAWVIPRGQSVPIAAGTFSGGRGISFTLTQHAAPGDKVVITLEPGSGGPAPMGPAVGQTVLS